MLGDLEMLYSEEADIIFARQCTGHDGHNRYVTRANIAAKEVDFSKAYGILPLLDKSSMCLYDKNNRSSRVYVDVTPIETVLYFPEDGTRDNLFRAGADIPHRV